MKKYMLLVMILFASSFLFVACDIGSEESIYIQVQNEHDAKVDDRNTNDQPNHVSNMTEEVAADQMFRYLREQNQASKGFEIHLDKKEQQEDNYIMEAYRLVGEEDPFDKETIGLFALDKTTGDIAVLH